MAVIAGKVPPPAAVPAEYVPRVVVKFRPDVKLPYTRAAAEQLADRDRRAWKEVTDAFPGLTLQPYFTSVAEEASAGRRGKPRGPVPPPG